MGVCCCCFNVWVPFLCSFLKSVGSKENTSPQSQSEAPVRLPGSSHFLLSSIGTDDSLQNVWKMLDRGLSSSAFSTSDSEDKGEQKSHKWATSIFRPFIFKHKCCVAPAILPEWAVYLQQNTSYKLKTWSSNFFCSSPLITKLNVIYWLFSHAE